MDAERTPVIVGVGEVIDRPDDLTIAREPLTLMADAMDAAMRDARGPERWDIDSLDVVSLTSWRYSAPARQLAALARITPSRAVYGPIGGESPIRYLHQAALRIAAGQSRVAAICGAEAQYNVDAAQRAGIELSWTPFAHDAPRPMRGHDKSHPIAVALGMAMPITVYPFYEQATTHADGMTPAQARAESALIWASHSRTAAANPHAWLRQPRTPAEIAAPGPSNRLIAWPYTKLMVANPKVNQGAAILVTSLAEARRQGVREDRMIHIRGGSHAVEPTDYLTRDRLDASQAQTAMLEAAMSLAPAHRFDAVELYSCFPCVPKMARRTLGLAAEDELSVTGGLTFFGAPLNNYMSHAAAAMVRRLRASGGTGLLYGQGEFVTKHHALLLSRESGPGLGEPSSVQSIADGRMARPPRFDPAAIGSAKVETFSIGYGRDGRVDRAAVILRMANGDRTMARVAVDDAVSLDRLIGPESPIGSGGDLRLDADGIGVWKAA